MKKIAIIGGGLSGLYATTLLEKTFDVTLFEAQERLGGRVCTINGFDLGPSWVWAHQHRILELILSLKLEIVPQYTKGEALYETPQMIERFTPPPSAPAGRIKGGIGMLIQALARRVQRAKIKLNEPIISIIEDGDRLLLKSSKQSYCFDEILITLPPRLLLETLKFEPPLSLKIKESFEKIPTWMGHVAKCVIEFETPFWREMGLSGFCFSLTGPMGEIHDACIEGRYALFGFINARANRATLEKDVRHQCERLFGEAGKKILNFYCIDWTQQHYTATKSDAIPLKSHPNYGFTASHMGGKIRFIGTESSYEEGGYLEGAIASTQF